MILPFDRDTFRAVSVADRPGDWGVLYDRLLAEIELEGGLSVEPPPPQRDPYDFTSERILDEAARLAARFDEEPVAVAVWEGQVHQPHDFTQYFMEEAVKRGMALVELGTLD